MGLSISCIDTLNHHKTSKALERTLVTLGDKVSKVYWFSDIDYPGNAVVNWVKIVALILLVQTLNMQMYYICQFVA